MAGSERQRQDIGLTAFHQDVIDLRVFFQDIAEWA